MLQSFSNNAYVVNWHHADPTILNNNNNIRWYGAYQSGYKVSPNLWQNQRTALSSYPITVSSFNDYDASQLHNLIRKIIPDANFIAINAPENGVVVEISTDGGNNWSDLPPVGGYPSDFSQTLNPSINACG